MSDENTTTGISGGLILPGETGSNLSQAASTLLQQVANTPSALSSIQITINLAQPVAGQTALMQTLPAGIIVRQAFTDAQGNAKVRISFIPDDRQQQQSDIDIRDNDIGEKSVWNKLLGDPDKPPKNTNIDTGVTVLRLSHDNTSGIITWLPSDTSENAINIPVEEADPANNAPVVGLGDFLGCISGKRNVMGANFNYPLAFSECLPQLFK